MEAFRFVIVMDRSGEKGNGAKRGGQSTVTNGGPRESRAVSTKLRYDHQLKVDGLGKIRPSAGTRKVSAGPLRLG